MSFLGGLGARPAMNAGNFRSFGNTGLAGVNRAGTGAPGLGARSGMNAGSFRSFGNTGLAGVNRAGVSAGRVAINNVYNSNINRSAGFGYGSSYGSGAGYRGYGYGWRNPYYGYHRGWLNGYWGGYYPWSYGWGLGNGFGYGLGWGLSNWLYGSSLYGYGYAPYYNPYCYAPTTVIVVPYDYSQPINTLGAAPADSVADEALALFSAARDAFKQARHPDALQLAEAALAKTPNDSSLHEFRALCLFALGRWRDEAAARPLRQSAFRRSGLELADDGQRLYSNVDAYTIQLRALEGLLQRPSRLSASGRFVLSLPLFDGGLHWPRDHHSQASGRTEAH